MAESQGSSATETAQDIVEDPRSDICSTINYWAQIQPDAPALEDETGQTSYAELAQLGERYASALLASGLKPGDRIAWLGRNASLYFQLIAAASRSGLVMVPVGWRLTAPEVRYILEDTGAKLLFVEPDFVDCAQQASDNLATGLQLIGVRNAPGLEGFCQWLERFEGQDVALPDADPQRAVIQLYTSGTTGNPKGAVLSNHNMFDTRLQMERDKVAWAHLEPHGSLLIAMPVAHIAGTGSGIICFFTGSKAMIVEQFTPDIVLDCVERGLTHMFLVPTALQMVVFHPRAASIDWSPMRMILYGAAPIPLDLLRKAIDVTGADFCQQYGMTETTGTFCALEPQDHDPAGNDRMRSAGRALSGVEIKIVDEHGQELPRGEIGEVVTRSSLNMISYWNNPQKTAETLDEGGWLHTGDAAYMDEDGYIFIQDRVKDMIITGGENVYPAEVENVIFSYPAVQEVAVFGVPDDKWGEAVKAAVTLNPGQSLDADALIAWTRERLAPYKTPKSIDVIEVMPRNATGKILRRSLREPYWQDRDSDLC